MPDVIPRARSLLIAGGLLMAACASPAPKDVADSAEVAATNVILAAPVIDSTALRDSAEATLAPLLDDPASATFDSVVVRQPAMVEGRWPMAVVCGRIGGKPGLGGRKTPTRFIYQNRFTVFVEEPDNQRQFHALWARTCAAEALEEA